MKRGYLLAVVLALLLGGCAGYRGKLDAHHQNAPTDFERQTLEWLTVAEKDTTPTLALEIPAALGDVRDSVDVRVLSNFFGTAPHEIEQKIAALQEARQMEESLSSELLFDDLLVAVALHNPGVAAAREEWQATLNQFSQADYLDQLINTWRSHTRYLDLGTGTDMQRPMPRESFPYPSVISFRGDMVRQEVRMAELEWSMALREAVVETAMTFNAYAYEFQAEQTMREEIVFLEGLVRVVDQRYRAGVADQMEFLAAQTELERKRNELEDIVAAQQVAAARLNALLNRFPEAKLGAPYGGHNYFIDANAAGIALQNRQELQIQQARVTRNQLAIRMGEIMNRPLLTQGYSLYDRGMMRESAEAGMGENFSARASTEPIPQYAQTESYLAELRSKLSAEQFLLLKEEAATRSEMTAALANWDTARREGDLVGAIVVPQSRSASRTASSGYIAGRIGFAEMLESERGALAAQLEQHESQRDLADAAFRIVNVAGTMAVLSAAPE